MLRVGVDTGGTFTDIVLLEDGKIRVFKLPSTPDQPQVAFLEGLGQFLKDHEGYLIQHGSTVATNTILERKGAVTLLVTNEGFEDVLEIGRQNRSELYNLSTDNLLEFSIPQIQKMFPSFSFETTAVGLRIGKPVKLRLIQLQSCQNHNF